MVIITTNQKSYLLEVNKSKELRYKNPLGINGLNTLLFYLFIFDKKIKKTYV